MTLQQKHEKLKSLFREMGRVAVAYSGGVDSALVLAVAHSVLNSKTLAVTGNSASLVIIESISKHMIYSGNGFRITSHIKVIKTFA